MSFFWMLVLIAAGVWIAAMLDRLARAVLEKRPIGDFVTAPLTDGIALFARQRTTTEHPDAVNWRLAPALYLGLAVAGISVVPLGRDTVPVDFEASIVLWGACEALTVVAVFLHGWSANAPLPLIGAYRYVATGLPVMLISMFVLIAAALPAESLAVTAIVESQTSVWNVLRQPLGLPLFLLLGLSLGLRGPFDYADSTDLAGGTSAEISGPHRAIWQLARLAMLVSAAALASAVFLGGHLGPVLPGPVWLVVKTVFVLGLLIAAGHLLPRIPAPRMVTLLWVVLLPLSFAGLVLAGIEALG